MRWLWMLCLVLTLMLPASLLADGCVLLEDTVSLLLQEAGAGRVLIEGQSVCGSGAAVTEFFHRRRAQ